MGWKGSLFVGNGFFIVDDVVCVMFRRVRIGFLMSFLKDSGFFAFKKRRRFLVIFVRTLNGRFIETLD